MSRTQGFFRRPNQFRSWVGFISLVTSVGKIVLFGVIAGRILDVWSRFPEALAALAFDPFPRIATTGLVLTLLEAVLFPFLATAWWPTQTQRACLLALVASVVVSALVLFIWSGNADPELQKLFRALFGPAITINVGWCLADGVMRSAALILVALRPGWSRPMKYQPVVPPAKRASVPLQELHQSEQDTSRSGGYLATAYMLQQRQTSSSPETHQGPSNESLTSQDTRTKGNPDIAWTIPNTTADILKATVVWTSAASTLFFFTSISVFVYDIPCFGILTALVAKYSASELLPTRWFAVLVSSIVCGILWLGAMFILIYKRVPIETHLTMHVTLKHTIFIFYGAFVCLSLAGWTFVMTQDLFPVALAVAPLFLVLALLVTVLIYVLERFWG